MLYWLLDKLFHAREGGQCLDYCYCVRLAALNAQYDLEDLVA